MTFKDSLKVKWSRYRPGVAQRVGRGIALLFHDRGTGRGWVVSSMPRPHFTPGPQGPVWTGGKSRPHLDSIPDRPTRSQSLNRLSYPVKDSLHLRFLLVGKVVSNVRSVVNLVWEWQHIVSAVTSSFHTVLSSSRASGSILPVLQILWY